MAESVKVSIRPANENDRGFVLSTWLRGQRYGCSYYSRMPEESYYKDYTKIVQNIIQTAGTRIDVATDENDPLWAVGYAVTQGNQLYWIFVKPDFRKLGIATLLLKDKKIQTVRSTTQIGLSLIKKYRLTYVPL